MRALLPKILRLTGFLTVWAVALSCVWRVALARSAPATAARRHDLSAPELELNGARFRTASGLTRRDQASLLRSFEAWCAPSPDDVTTWLRAVAAGGILPPARSEGRRYPALRGEDDAGGYVFCATPPEPRTIGGPLEAADIRILYTRRAPGGTSYLAAWSSAPVAIEAVVDGPSREDDQRFAGPPAPRSSRALLVAGVTSDGPRMTIYTSAAPLARVDHEYRAQLRATGWRILAAPPGRATAFAATRAGALAWLTVSEDPRLGTLVTVVLEPAADGSGGDAR